MSDADLSDALPIAACPAAECDRGPFETVAAVRGHSNATGPEHPSWREIEQLIEERHLNVDADHDQDADQDADADGGDDEEEAAMPTQQEYEDQHAADDDDTDAPTPATGGTPIPMDPRTLGLLLAVALALYLAYRAVNGDADPGAGIEEAEPGDGAGVESSADTVEVEGGLAG